MVRLGWCLVLALAWAAWGCSGSLTVDDDDGSPWEDDDASGDDDAGDAAAADDEVGEGWIEFEGAPFPYTP